MMHDYSEGFININKLLEQGEKLCRERKFEDARKVVEQIRGESDRLMNWLWKNEDA